MVVLLIILIVPLLLHRLKIPHVIGLILAGVVVGPYGLNLLARDMSFEVFGQVGILYLMFLAGIEIDMYHLQRNLRKGLIFGFLTFSIPLVLGAVVASALLELPPLSSLLLASMFASHTLIAYPIVSRFGLTKSPAVMIAISATIFAVLGSLIVLAGVAGVCREGEFSASVLLKMLGMLVVYCLACAYIYPRLSRWFFRKFSDPIAQFIYVLAMVFIAAMAAISIGIEGVFGAFLAGILLNRFVPTRSPLMGRLEFVGNAIFIPYFLIGVGMLINIKVVVSGWTTAYVALVMSVTAMGTKWLAARVMQKISHMSSSSRSMMYQLTNAHTAVALAVVMIGYETGIFGEAILNGTVIMILVTCTISSIGTSRAAAKIKIEELEQQQHEIENAKSDSGPMSATNTLIPIANPLVASELVSLALLMRGDLRRPGKVYALHVRNDNSASSRAVGRNSLDTARQLGASIDVAVEPIERFDLNFIAGVTNTIEERDINEVVIGLHRRTQVIDSFYGDKLPALLKATNKMVMIVRCFVPANTLRRLVVFVPDKAQFETGFRRWVHSLANLTGQLGCEMVICCNQNTRRAIETVLLGDRLEIPHRYKEISQWDDFILLSNKIMTDDLFVVVCSRRTAVSFTADMDELPNFLNRYYANNNLLIVFPEQFGKETGFSTMAETLAADLEATPSPLWVKLRAAMRKAMKLSHSLAKSGRPSDFDL